VLYITGLIIIITQYNWIEWIAPVTTIIPNLKHDHEFVITDTVTQKIIKKQD